jgi:hypothetical protein
MCTDWKCSHHNVIIISTTATATATTTTTTIVIIVIVVVIIIIIIGSGGDGGGGGGGGGGGCGGICYHLYIFMQGIYNYILEKDDVSRLYSVAATLYLQFMQHVMLFLMLNVLYFYISTF